MVKVTIIGWYGTETIGDRAILAGILISLKESIGNFEIQLGAIYPFYTERTLLEDLSFYRECVEDDNLQISIFDTQQISELNKSIKWSDILIMGGGPIMGIWPLCMIEYAFKKAKKLKKKTAIFGCGVGPIVKNRYNKTLINIIDKSDLTIFRDEGSADLYRSIAKNKAKEVFSAIDPAVIAACKYKELYPYNMDKDDVIISCIRDFPMEYKIDDSISNTTMNKRVAEILLFIQKQSNRPISLLPMHYFSIGGDDRVCMSKFKTEYDNSARIEVQQQPLSLKQTFSRFTKASMCVGMRFHSVVLQTILNGNNIIVDYTNPQTGKISGFLKQIEAYDTYKNRYINIQGGSDFSNIELSEPYKINMSKISELTAIYTKMGSLLNEYI